MASAVPTTLSREILKWIQSLDLAYSVKNAKRDFSNGFLVAEIFSRYYDKDIQMHSFDNGNGTAAKKDNWAQLLKFFRKRNIQPGDMPISQDEVDAIIHCRNGAVVIFLNKVYEFLSGRKVQTPPPPPKMGDMPPFAKPTASTVLRDSMMDPKFQLSDISASERKMQETLDMHEAGLQAERAADPLRFTTQQRAPSKVLRGQTRTVGAEEAKQRVTVKRVNVKHVDTNVAQLRATKAMHASSSKMGQSQSMASGGSALGGGPSMEMAARAFTPAIDILNDAVASALKDNNDVLDALDTAKPMAIAFVEVLRASPDLPEVTAAAVFDSIASQSNALASACLSGPKEFWQCMSVLEPCLVFLPETSAPFGAVTDAFVALGDALVVKDTGTTHALMADFGIRPLCNILKRWPQKRQAVLSIVYSFSAPDIRSHVQSIRLLQETLDDVPAFVSCLAYLIFLEETFDTDLLDVYYYYCSIGKSQTSPSLRAAAVGMLSVISVQDPALVAKNIDSLVTLVDDPWWEVRAQLVVVCSVLLSRLPSDSEASGVASDIISTIMRARNPACTTRVALSYLAPFLGKLIETHPSLLTDYVRALLELPAPSRERLLYTDGGADETPIVAGSGLKYSLTPLPAQWPAVAVAQGLAGIIQADKLEHMEVEHFQVLLAALEGDAVADSAWVPVFHDLKDHIFVAMCDPECSELALGVMAKFMFDSALQHEVLKSSTLVGSMLLLHRPSPEPNDQVKAGLAQLLQQAAESGAAYADAVKALLAAFHANNRDMYLASPLKAVGDLVGFSGSKK